MKYQIWFRTSDEHEITYSQYTGTVSQSPVKQFPRTPTNFTPFGLINRLHRNHFSVNCPLLNDWNS